MTQFDINNRVVVITGGFGKLGIFFAKALLELFAKVIVVDLPDSQCPEMLLVEKEKHPDSLFIQSGDVTIRDSLEVVRDSVQEQFGRVDILLNNAGIDQPPGNLPRSYRLDEIPFEVCQGIVNVNLLGVFQTTQVFLPLLRKSAGPSIINIGSQYATISPDQRFYDHLGMDPPFLKPPMYGASKAGVINLTKYLATHLGPLGIRVNAMSPGGVAGGQDSEFRRKFCERVPLGRMAELDDLIGPLVFLASDASRYVTGIDLLIDGGFTAW